MAVRHEQAIKEPPHSYRVLMIVIMVMSVPAAVLVVMALIVVVAILDVDRVAVLTVNMLGAVARHRYRIGVYKIMRAGRIVRVDMPGRARCVILPVATDVRFRTVHRAPSCRVRWW
jgi:hypothetical protein